MKAYWLIVMLLMGVGVIASGCATDYSGNGSADPYGYSQPAATGHHH